MWDEMSSGLDLTEEDYRLHELEAEAEDEFLTELDDKINRK